MDPNECCVCMERRKTNAFDPCGHKCVCEICASKLGKCPICNQVVTKSIRIYDDSDTVNQVAEPTDPKVENSPEPKIDKPSEPKVENAPETNVVKVPETNTVKVPIKKSFSVEVENLYDPKDFSSHGCWICPYLIQGCCISVKWAEHWHECFVLSYNEKDGTHKCRYHGGRNGGLERTYHLNRKTFLVVSVPPSLLDSRMRDIELSKEYAKRVGAFPKPQFLVNVNYEYDPNRYSQRLDNNALVCCRIGIRWTSGNYHTCWVQSYNYEDGTHTCVYSSGRRRDLHLNRFHFVMVSTFQQQSISLTGPPPTKDEVCPLTKDEVCPETQMVDIMLARPWADVVPPKEPTRYPLL